MPKCKWNVKSNITDRAKKLSAETNLSPVVVQILINRGYAEKNNIDDFLSPSLSKLPDPFMLSDLEKASNRVADAVQNKEKICIYGDYDIDGTTAIASLVGFLKSLKVNVVYYQPERLGDGYGFHIEAVKKIKEQGSNLIITVDCATTNIDTALYCVDEKIDLIITDHHNVGKTLPQTFAFINPYKEGENKVFQNLAGVGVAYYLMIGVRKVLRDRGYFSGDVAEPDLKNYLDIVALGTIADVVPIQGMNRILVKKGLELLNSNPRVGLKALVNVSNLKTKIDCEAVGFILSPRMNAAGRMGSASRSVELLLTSDDKEAVQLAGILQEENNKRMAFQKDSWVQAQSIVEKIKEEDPKGFEEKFTITLVSKDWHQGIIGIVASKSVDRWFKPTAVFTSISNGIAKGSVRSIPGIDVFSVFSEFRDIFEDFGGHDMAAGMSIKEDRLPKFTELFESGARRTYSVSQLIQSLDVEVEVKPSDIGLRVVNEIAMMEPFGIDNPAPLFFTRTKIFNKWVLKEKHLKLKLDNGIDAIGFNMGEFADSVGSSADIVFKPSINEWNGTKQLQYILADID